MDTWIETFRQAKTTQEHDHVIIPGDPERLTTLERTNNGIPLLDVVIDDLNLIGKKFNISL
jgi:LDH2 family malate/lactate/ureidoglycolate dehydrogenase